MVTFSRYVSRLYRYTIKDYQTAGYAYCIGTLTPTVAMISSFSRVFCAHRGTVVNIVANIIRNRFIGKFEFTASEILPPSSNLISCPGSYFEVYHNNIQFRYMSSNRYPP